MFKCLSLLLDSFKRVHTASENEVFFITEIGNNFLPFGLMYQSPKTVNNTPKININI